MLWLDVRNGLGGDMFTAALAGLGLDLSPLQGAFDAAGIAVSLDLKKTVRKGLAGLSFNPTCPALQPLRHLADLVGLVEKLDVSNTVAAKAKAAFVRLAEVEAAVHGVAVETIHFHEVGAMDTLVDVVGAFWGLETLGIDTVESSPLPWFSGTVDCAHGCIPLPAPAVVKLLEGKPVFSSGLEFECLTPTGALILDQAASRFGEGPSGRLAASAIAFGNCEAGGPLRAFLLERSERPEYETVVELAANLDHLSGELLGDAFAEIFTADALDALYTPGVGKKNRPAGVMTALCRPEDEERVAAAFFRATLTLGLRRRLVERRILPRRATTVETPFGPIAAKAFTLDGVEYVRPEYEAVRELAAEVGLTTAQLLAKLTD